MKNEPLKIAISSQKGGVGKTTLTVLVASYLHYVKGNNVTVFDCDFPQHSIHEMRERDVEMVMNDTRFKQLAQKQFEKLGRSAYRIIETSAPKVEEELRLYQQNEHDKIDYIFFDLPGTLNSSGVVKTLATMDILLVPIIADRVVMESSLQFVTVLRDNIMTTGKGSIKAIYLIWNMVDRRESNDLYRIYEQIISKLGFETFQTYLPDTKKFRKELFANGTVFRSTLFPIDKNFTRYCRVDEFVEEFITVLKQIDHGQE